MGPRICILAGMNQKGRKFVKRLAKNGGKMTKRAAVNRMARLLRATCYKCFFFGYFMWITILHRALSLYFNYFVNFSICEAPLKLLMLSKLLVQSHFLARTQTQSKLSTDHCVEALRSTRLKVTKKIQNRNHSEDGGCRR